MLNKYMDSELEAPKVPKPESLRKTAFAQSSYWNGSTAIEASLRELTELFRTDYPYRYAKGGRRWQ